MDALTTTDATTSRGRCTESGSAVLAPVTAEEPAEPMFDLRSLCAGVIGGFGKLAEDVLGPAELSLVQWRVLERCARGQASTVTSLAACIPIDPAAISRAADYLVRRGLLERRRLRQDRRVVRLEVTAQGRALTRRLEREFQPIYATLVEGVVVEELQVFARVARRISTNAHAQHGRPAPTSPQVA